MFKIKVVLTAFLVVLAVNAVATSSASAGWVVEGTELAEGSKAALATTAKVTTATILSMPSLKTKITCKGSLLKGETAEIIGTTTLKAKSLTFEGCETLEPKTGCELESQPKSIPTNPLVATTVAGATFPENGLTFTAQTKTVLANIAFKEKNTCALEGEEPVKGAVTLNLPTGEEELSAQTIQGLGSTENNSLEVGGTKAYIENGAAILKLASGNKWRADKPAHWYKEGVILPEKAEANALAVETGSGTETVGLFNLTAGEEGICKMKDTGKIWNPVGGGPGKGKIATATFSGCTSKFCKPAETPELKEAGTPWSTELRAGKLILLKVANMGIQVICDGKAKLTYQGSPEPAMLNGEGKGETDCVASTHTTYAEFPALKWFLKSGLERAIIEGKDCIWDASPAKEKITVKSP